MSLLSSTLGRAPALEISTRKYHFKEILSKILLFYKRNLVENGDRTHWSNSELCFLFYPQVSRLFLFNNLLFPFESFIHSSRSKLDFCSTTAIIERIFNHFPSIAQALASFRYKTAMAHTLKGGLMMKAFIIRIYLVTFEHK